MKLKIAGTVKKAYGEETIRDLAWFASRGIRTANWTVHVKLSFSGLYHGMTIGERRNRTVYVHVPQRPDLNPSLVYEALWIMAHEFKHIEQFNRKPRLVARGRKRIFSEKKADVYANTVVAAFKGLLS